MRPDLDDLNFRPHAVHNMDMNSDEFALVVLHSVGKGSNTRSPSLHGSGSLSGAHRFAFLAQDARGESSDSQIMVMIRIWD